MGTRQDRGQWGGRDVAPPTTRENHACGVRHEHECKACGRVSPCCLPECSSLHVGQCAGQCDSRGLARKAALQHTQRRRQEVAERYEAAVAEHVAAAYALPTAVPQPPEDRIKGLDVGQYADADLRATSMYTALIRE